MGLGYIRIYILQSNLPGEFEPRTSVFLVGSCSCAEERRLISSSALTMSRFSVEAVVTATATRCSTFAGGVGSGKAPVQYPD